MKNFSTDMLTLTGLLLLLVQSTPAWAQCAGFEYCTLVWSDEFDGTEVDTTKWSFQRGDGSEVSLPPGWGNNELQWYTDQNATVADGFLTITAREETVEPGWLYTSSRLRSLRRGDWTYGRMEMRARMPVGKGLWPAFWMLPSDRGYGGWAASGEIDIVEYIGSNPDEIFGTIHYGGEWPMNVSSSSQYTLPSGTFDEGFHEFAIEWEEGEIRWYVDDIHYGTKASWYSSGGDFPAPFDVDFHLLLNLAVGGNLPGRPDASTQFPQEYVIDYVRVYKESDAPAFVINPGLNDAWFNLATRGQGALLTVFPDRKEMFLAWFTYDTERPPEDVGAVLGEPGHRWLTAQGPYDGHSATLTVYSTEGGVFDSPDPAPASAPVGTMTVEFADCYEGIITYEMTTPLLSGEIPIQRITNDNVALCETFASGGGN